ncbi:MAG TPA: hypothetical protein VIC55_12580 [Gemmatimonadaceae bacterium]|jgi:hypothetical protein
MPVPLRANDNASPMSKRIVAPILTRVRRVAAIVGLVAAAAPAAVAQCRPPANSNDAKLLAFYSAPIAFSMDAAPQVMAPGAVRIEGELEPMPIPSAALQQTGPPCFVSKNENTRLAPIFARPRITVGLPAGFIVEASYVPPIRFYDADPQLGSFALSRAQRLPAVPWGGSVTLLVRAHGTVGQVRGPITCPTKALQTDDPGAPCFGTVPSRDTFHPYMVGGEGALSLTTRNGRVSVYAGAGITWLRPRFQVGFVNGDAVTDSTRVEVNLTRGTVFGGVTAKVTRAFELSAQVYSQLSDVTTIRVSAGYVLH